MGTIGAVVCFSSICLWFSSALFFSSVLASFESSENIEDKSGDLWLQCPPVSCVDLDANHGMPLYQYLLIQSCTTSKTYSFLSISVCHQFLPQFEDVEDLHNNSTSFSFTKVGTALVLQPTPTANKQRLQLPSFVVDNFCIFDKSCKQCLFF